MNTPATPPAPQKITPDCQPVFPCWLWLADDHVWQRHNPPDGWMWLMFAEWFRSKFNHWLPDQPTAPTCVPTEGEKDLAQLRIVAAAVIHGGVVHTAPHHHLAMWQISCCWGEKAHGDQGFVASDGKFYDRVAAKRIARDAGQIKFPLAHEPEELFSEELWSYSDWCHERGMNVDGVAPPPTHSAQEAAERYEVAFDKTDEPSWVVRVHHGPYVSYHYTEESARTLCAILNRPNPQLGAAERASRDIAKLTLSEADNGMVPHWGDIANILARHFPSTPTQSQPEAADLERVRAMCRESRARMNKLPYDSPERKRLLDSAMATIYGRPDWQDAHAAALKEAGFLPTRSQQPPLSREAALDALEKYPNLQAIIQNTISGHYTEWPLVAIELRKLLAEQPPLSPGSGEALL